MKSIKAQPLMKWPGGKRRVLPELVKYVPKDFNSYYEPFIGGGALFFELEPENAFITDINTELINLYEVVKSQPDALIQELKDKKYVNEAEAFNEIRALDRSTDVFNSLSKVQRAARTIYLNRTCFNGLYRVNSNNQFNAPFGRYAKPRILDEPNILASSALFNDKNVSIKNSSFNDALNAVKGTQNFIYLDPPYIPLTPTASFVSYAKDGFSYEQQEELRDKALELDNQGNFILLSNSDTPITRELYSDFVIVPIQVKRSVGANASSRVAVGEVLALSPSLAKHLGL